MLAATPLVLAPLPLATAVLHKFSSSSSWSTFSRNRRRVSSSLSPLLDTKSTATFKAPCISSLSSSTSPLDSSSEMRRSMSSHFSLCSDIAASTLASLSSNAANTSRDFSLRPLPSLEGCALVVVSIPLLPDILDICTTNSAFPACTNSLARPFVKNAIQIACLSSPKTPYFGGDDSHFTQPRVSSRRGYDTNFTSPREACSRNRLNQAQLALIPTVTGTMLHPNESTRAALVNSPQA
ncbi:hypothetical protein MANES_14G074101v8 [Manihot esculenta]|uniref:Uncharacterized protein n=1 Tax=Manihot esculenta TaxID=3983 RepID=A0ACB7GEW9_MANES|nr:hypothetical protein MANES_14G074101v8 [Manihot esculenta]